MSFYCVFIDNLTLRQILAHEATQYYILNKDMMLIEVQEVSAKRCKEVQTQSIVSNNCSINHINCPKVPLEIPEFISP